MHLAIISPYPPAITGIGQYGYHVSRLLANSGVFSKITILSGDNTLTENNNPHQIEVRPGWKPNHLDIGWRIPSYLHSIKPDAVWFNMGVSIFGKSPFANLSGFISPGWTRLLGIPSVLTLHELPELADLRALRAPGGIFALYGARLLSRLATFADVICLTMKHYVDWLSTSHPGPYYLHIPIGPYYPPEKLPEPVNPELLFFSTLTPFKGIENLLDAFQILQKDYPTLRLTIAGADNVRFPNYASQIMAKYSGLTGVTWRGQVPEAEIRPMFLRASMVVLPYCASTGASSMLIQAASWGKAIIASDLDEIQTIARENNLDVTFFKRGEVSDLVNALRLHLSSPDRHRSKAEHNFAAILYQPPEVMCRSYLHAINLAFEAHRNPLRIIYPGSSSTEMN